MQFICPSCFVRPGAVAHAQGNEAPDLMVSMVAPLTHRPAAVDALSAFLRCDTCGSAIQLERPHLAWYGL